MNTVIRGLLLGAFFTLAANVATATDPQLPPDAETPAAVSPVDGVIAYANEGYYKGEMHDGKRNGQGVYLYPDYGIYTGQWKDGRKDGWGTYQWPNGDIYQGEWQGGIMHGRGTLVFADGGIFEGLWVNGDAQDDKVPVQAAITDAEREAQIREKFCELKEVIAEARKAFAPYFASAEAAVDGAEAGQVVTRGIDERCR